uniref:MATH domain-containing protein n=1 Tax=Steinernema glaseri TaxID=37863 RepID=A0A1I7Y4M4_9BILA
MKRLAAVVEKVDGIVPDRSDFYPPELAFPPSIGRTIPSRPSYRTRPRAKTSVACQTDDHPDYPRIPKSLASATPMTSSADPSGSNSDGTLRLLIQSFRNMADTVRGPCKNIQNVPWRIMVMPRQHVVQKKGTQKCLGFFLQCCPDAYSDSWSCQAAAELRLISQKQGVPHFTRKTNHTYTSKENDWGYSCFMTWADILDESQGYIKDDNVILEVSVKAEAPKNILTQEQFGKKIQDYKRLADLQCSRGLIDKAIEVNASALKFCKDKDPERKTELEAQKLKLIEMKLKESIERIEKGDEENSVSNLNALKQAISANTTKSRGNHKHCSNKHKESRDLEKRSKTPPVLPNHAKNKTHAPVSVPPPPEPVPTQPVVQKKTPPTAQVGEPGTPPEPILSGQFNEDLLSNVQDNARGKTQTHDSSNDLPDDLKHTHVQPLFDDDEVNTNFLKQYIYRQDVLSAQPPTPQEAVNNPIFQKKLQHVYDSSTLFCQPIKLEKMEKCTTDGDDELSSSEDDTYGYGTYQLDVPPGKRMRHSNDIDERNVDSYPFYADILDYPSEMQPEILVPCNLITTTDNKMCQTDFAPATSQGPVEDAVRLKPVSAPVEPKVAGRPFAQPTRKSATRRAAAAAAAAAAKEAQENKEKIPPIVDIYAGLPLRSSNDQSQKAETDSVTTEVSKADEDDSSNASTKTQNDSSGTMDNGSIASTDSSSNSSTTSGSTSQTLAYSMDGNSLNTFSMNIMPMEFAMDVYHNFAQHFANTVASQADPNAGKHKITTVDESTAQKLLNSNYLEDWVKANVKNHKFHQAITAMSIVSINCMNTRRIVDKACEFLDSMENAATSEDVRTAMNCLSMIANEGVIESEESTPESSPEREPATATNFVDDVSDYALNQEEKRLDDCVTVTRRYLLTSDAAALKRNVEKIALKFKNLTTELTSVKDQLQDERARSARLEEKMKKTNQALAAQLTAEKDKNDKNERALKERKNEMKKLEKKAKAEAQLTIDLAAAREQLDTLQKENVQLQRKLNEEQLKYKRDTQSLSDSKKHIQAELSSREGDLSKMSNQLEEKTQALRKAESLLANERKQNQSALNTAVERGKKAEIGLLEHKLEVGLQILERARDDCQKNVRELEETLKRIRNPGDIEVVRKSIGDWRAKKEEIIGLINGTKTEFQTHITSIKNGKLLSQLPKIAVPKPPPGPPRIQLVLPQNSPSEKHVSPAAPGVIGVPSGSSLPVEIPGSPVPKSTPSVNFNTKPVQPNPICLTPIGVRPSAYINGNSVCTTPARPQSTTNMGPSPASPSQMMSAPQSSISISPWPWSDPLQNYTESLLASSSTRTFGPIGAEYAAVRSLSMEQPSTSYAPGAPGASATPAAPGTPNNSMIARSRNGWDPSRGPEWAVEAGVPPPMHNGNGPNQYSDVPATYGGRWSNSTWQGYTTSDTSQASESRSESPLLRMNTTELKDEFFNHMNYLLPGASNQLLVDYFDRFCDKVKSYCIKNQADVTPVMVEALTRSISLLLLENPELLEPLRNSEAKPQSMSSSSTSTAMSTLFEVFCHTLNRFAGGLQRKVNRNEESMVCGFCVMPIATQQQHRTLKCMHFLHEKCFKDWTSKKQFCAICGKRTMSDEFPELSK